MILIVVMVVGLMIYSVVFLHDEQLVCVDKMKLNGIFTYVSDDRQRSSWIDHILCSQALLSQCQ